MCLVHNKSSPVNRLQHRAVCHDHLKGGHEDVELVEFGDDLVFGIAVEELVLPNHVSRLAVAVVHNCVHVRPALEFFLPVWNRYESHFFTSMNRLIVPSNARRHTTHDASHNIRILDKGATTKKGPRRLCTVKR